MFGVRNLFETILDLGEYQGHPLRKFTFSDYGKAYLFGRKTAQDTIVYFGHAGDPESLESATAKAVWMDEAGQNTEAMPPPSLYSPPPSPKAVLYSTQEREIVSFP